METLNFLLQHDYTLSERQAAELLWSRFFNGSGHPGKNIPNDLKCEHLNRLCKTAVSGLMANKTPECISRVAKALGTISPVLENFDADNGVGTCSTVHKEAKCEQTLSMSWWKLEFSLHVLQGGTIVRSRIPESHYMFIHAMKYLTGWKSTFISHEHRNATLNDPSHDPHLQLPAQINITTHAHST